MVTLHNLVKGYKNLLRARHLFQYKQDKIILVLPTGACDLRDILRAKRKSNIKYKEDELLQFLFDITESLIDLAKAELKHNDIKETNIVFPRNPSRFTLIDFDCSNLLGDEAFRITEGYYNENIAQSDPNKLDIWCLGIVVLNMINLKRYVSLGNIGKTFV